MTTAPKRVVISGGELQTPQAAFQSKSSYVQRLIEVTVKLAPDQGTNQPVTFAGTNGSDTVTFSGFRTSARIENSGAPAGSRAEISVFGLGESVMNQLSTLGMVFNSIQRNTITISAGDAGSGMTPVFSGTITHAFGDFNRAPKVPFRFECQTGLFDNIAPVPASSFPQATDVATIMAGFARQMNLGFENNGITAQLPPSYFPGTAFSQMRRCAQAAHINAEIIQNKLVIWPIGGSRTSLTSAEIPLISKNTGMIGYPSFAPNGYLVVNSLFNPLVAFGGQVRIESKLPQANKTWVVQKLDLALDSFVPHGEWRSTMFCYPLGFSAPVPPQASS